MSAIKNSHFDTVELANKKISDGEARFLQGDVDGAIAAFRDVLEFDQDNVRANGNLGVVLWQIRDRENALIYLNRAYTADPDDKVALTNLADVYLALQQEQEVLRIYNGYLDRHPDENEIQRILNALNPEQGLDTESSLEHQLLGRAEELQARNRIDEAMAVLDAVLVLSDERLAVHRKIGELCCRTHQKNRAIQHLTIAFRLDSLDKTIVLQLSGLFCELGLFDAAIHTCLTYLSLKPEDRQVIDLLEKCRQADTSGGSVGAGEPAQDTENSIIARVPVMGDVLNALPRLGVEIRAILDVGVCHGTPPLMRKFPDLKHYLFEPINDHFDMIHSNYSKFDYQLFHVALSSSDGEAWQNGLCNNGSGLVTHSQIGDKPMNRDEDPRFIKAERVPMARLDTLMKDLDVAVPYLLKLDVDGHELPILEGARETLKNAAVVIIEATAGSFLDRANFLAEEGFVLFDIVDFAYYSGVLHQVDIVLIRKEFLDTNDRLCPMRHGAFKLSHWHQVTASCFSPY